ncbi:porin family protein [Sphingobacterium sp.]|uniref:porin family protein n=1 Tax=Sphingobacterium sp. TaxID=341027 RepID=UPI002898732C|nr:porin family protein [Sphingobacterium sp.]
MKIKLLSIAAALCFIAGAKAQISFGIRGAANFAKEVRYSKQGSSANPAITRFQVASYVEIPIGSDFSFQPGVAFQQTGSKMSTGYQDGEVLMDGWRKVQYLELPLNIIHYFPQNNLGRFFIGAGPYASIAMSGEEKFSKNIVSISFGTDKHIDNMKKYDAGLNFLLGFKLTNGFSVYGGYGLGLLDVKLDDEISTYNRVFSLGLGYQLSF